MGLLIWQPHLNIESLKTRGKKKEKEKSFIFLAMERGWVMVDSSGDMGLAKKKLGDNGRGVVGTIRWARAMVEG